MHKHNFEDNYDKTKNDAYLTEHQYLKDYQVYIFHLDSKNLTHTNLSLKLKTSPRTSFLSFGSLLSVAFTASRTILCLKSTWTLKLPNQ